MAREPLCRYCLARGRITPADRLDHIIALSLGGSNDEANLAPACQPCNDAKGRDEARYLSRGYDPLDIEHDPALREWIMLSAKAMDRAD